LELVAQIESAQAKIPGLQLAGSAYHGVGIPDSIASGQAAADRVLKGQID
jgi:oxygen-dependent protoporphyrinogen oxidase